MSLTKVQTIGIETGISFTGVTTITSLNATQGANISISSPGVALTITQSGTGGYVQVGTSSTVAVIDNSGRFLVGVASTTSDSRAVFQGSSASATGGTNVYFQRGSTPASGDKLGLFAFADVHGKVGAEISAYADATWSLGDYPGRLVFSTTPDGSSTVTERLRIDDNGNLILDSDLDTYIHHPAADTLAVTTGGLERVRIDSSGRFGIGTNSPSTLIHGAVSSGTANLRLENTATSGEATIQLYGKNSGGTVRTATIKYDNADYFRIGTTAAVAIAFETSDTERLRIDSSGRLLVGTSSTSSSALLQVQGNSSSSTGDAIIQLRVGKNNVSILNGNSLGSIQFSNTESTVSAVIEAVADANWNTTNDYPSRLVFSTTADAGSTPTERMRINSSGQIITTGTFVDPAITGTILEDIYTITDGAAFEVDPGNGSVQLITLGASRTPKATNFAAGESVTLMVADGTAYTLTWTDSTWGSGGVVWVGGSAPTLATTGYTVIQFWKVSTQVYGARVGDVA